MYKKRGKSDEIALMTSINTFFFTVIDIFRQNNLEPGGDREREREREMLGRC